MKIQTLMLAGLLSVGVTAAYAKKVVFSDIHADIDVGFEDGAIGLVVHDHTHDVEYEAKQVILRVNGNARTTVPADPAYSFLGESNKFIWILPAVQDPTLLFLGTAGEEIPAGVFQGDSVRLSLLKFTGAGEFAMYAFDPFGVPVVEMNTRDGIDADDGVDIPAGGHTDYNFAFSKPGVHRVTLQATGTLLDGTVVSSDRVTYTFRVVRPSSKEL
jgi:surface-anchored protein